MSERHDWASPRVVTVVGVVLLATGCWAITAVRMHGMDAGPGGDLGTTGWFLGTWVAMMAAMMLPVVVPVVVRYRPPRAPGAATAPSLSRVVFLASYLVVWALAGLVVYAVIAAGRHLLGDLFAWRHGGRWAATAVLAAAAGYQLTPQKRRALERCKRGGRLDGPAWPAGLSAGINCLSSSWVMMAALFALGAMSLWWMAVVAVLIAAERLPRPSAPGRVTGAVVFLALALGVAVSPATVPGLTVPGSPGARGAMMHMSPSSGMTGGAAKTSSNRSMR